MSPEDEYIDEGLSQPCVADTSLLSNFVHVNQTALLNRLIRQAVFLSPTVLDPREMTVSAWTDKPPTSEFLKPYYQVQHGDYSDYYSNRVPYIVDFLKGRDQIWKPVLLSLDELRLTERLGNRDTGKRLKEMAPQVRGRVRVDAGEAEAAAVAISRNWTLLVDDRSVIQVIRHLYPKVKVLQTCQLISYAARQGFIPCSDAAKIFNDDIVADLGFYASRKVEGVTQNLILKCSPPRCEWT